ncbi:MAG: hypothetical protein J6Y02_16955 [Pseudobutyrivibrio sp.]|nr:hypothetical protein [Pseudobutyrivibrio sp.]
MKYLVTEMQHHKTGAVVIKNTEKTEYNGTAGALRLFYDTLSLASVSTSQMKCQVSITDENMVRLKYDEVVNPNVVPDPDVVPEAPEDEITE